MPITAPSKGIAASAVVAGLVIAVPLMPAAATAATYTPSAVRAYGAPPVVNVSVNQGGNSITVNVGGNASGTVTVTIGGRDFTRSLVNGRATFGFPANLPLGRYSFRVRYNGPGGTTSVFTSTLFVTRFGTVVGVQAYRALLRAHGVGANRAGVSGAESGMSLSNGSSSSGGQSGLAPTGTSTQTELLGLLGLGLLTAGGSSIVVARRRARV